MLVTLGANTKISSLSLNFYSVINRTDKINVLLFSRQICFRKVKTNNKVSLLLHRSSEGMMFHFLFQVNIKSFDFFYFYYRFRYSLSLFLYSINIKKFLREIFNTKEKLSQRIIAH